MDASTTGIVYFAAVVLICSILAHALQKQFWFAVGLASAASTAVLQVAVIYKTGYLDPYFPMAVAISLVIGAVCSAAVGAVFLLIRRSR